MKDDSNPEIWLVKYNTDPIAYAEVDILTQAIMAAVRENRDATFNLSATEHGPRYVAQWADAVCLLIPDAHADDVRRSWNDPDHDGFCMSYMGFEELVSMFILNTFDKPGVQSFGVWHDPSWDRWVIAPNIHLDSEEEMQAHLALHNQSSAWDTHEGAIVSTTQKEGK